MKFICFKQNTRLKILQFRSDTRIQLYVIFLYVALSIKGPQQQLIYLQV